MGRGHSRRLLLSRERAPHRRAYRMCRVSRGERNESFVINTMFFWNGGHGKRACEEEVKGRWAVGESVPWLRHPPSRSQTDQGETHPLMTHKRTEGGKKSSSKRSTSRGNRRRSEKVVPRVLLTDVLIPYPLFPALAIRRRYFLLCQAGEVQRAQTIKCDRHSG